MSVTLGNIYMKTASLGSHDVYEMSLGNNIVRPIPNTITGNNYVSLSNALMNRLEYLKIYGNTEQGLPSGYTQLEYIQSTGTQYIDTGIICDNTCEVSVRAVTAYSNPAVQLFGNNVNTTKGLTCNVGRDSSNVSRFGNASYTGTIFKDATNIHTYKTNSTGIYVDDDAVIPWSGTVGTFTQDTSLYILAARVSSGAANIMPNGTRLYEGIINKNNVLVLHIVPAKRNSDNVIGMYDLVSNTFFTNAGTGTFTAGPTAVPTPENPIEVKGVGDSLLPSGYTQLEYIEGTSILTLNNKTTNNTEIEAKWYRRTSTAQYLYYSDSGSTLTTNTTAYISSSGNWRFGNKTVTISFNVGGTYTTIQNKNGIWIDGAKKYTYSNVGTFTSTNNLKVLSGVPEHPLRLYYLKQSESGTLVGHYIPCKYGNDVGLYDLVGKEFYTDSGIIAGPEILYQIPVKVNNILQQTIYINSPLHKIGNYQDVLNSDGTITRNVGVKVLDGTEDWRTYAERNDLFLLDSDDAFKPTAPMFIFCTHLKGSSESTASQSQNTIRLTYGDSSFGLYSVVVSGVTTLSGLTTFLADQYANGTPVIVYYPLATPTTETITMQPIQISEGNNTIELQLNDIDNTQLEVKYSSWK